MVGIGIGPEQHLRGLASTLGSVCVSDKEQEERAATVWLSSALEMGSPSSGNHGSLYLGLDQKGSAAVGKLTEENPSSTVPPRGREEQWQLQSNLIPNLWFSSVEAPTLGDNVCIVEA